MQGPVHASISRVPVCGVLSTARHQHWSDRVLEELQHPALDGLVFQRLPCQPGMARTLMMQVSPPPRLLLAFATPDTLNRVRRVLRSLGEVRPPTLLVARGLRQEVIERLLDGGVEDVVAQPAGADELVSRVHRLMGQGAPMPALREDAGAPPPEASPCIPCQPRDDSFANAP